MIALQSRKRSVLEKQQAERGGRRWRDLPGAVMPVAWVMLNGAAGSGPLGQ